MKKLSFYFFIVLSIILINIGCSKKSATQMITTVDTAVTQKNLDTTTVAGGNGAGSAANQISSPGGIYVDKGNNIYVTDLTNNRVQKWIAGSDSGITIAGGNGAGAAANQLNLPVGVWLDSSGNVYVSDYNNARIQKFPPGSTSLTSGITAAGGNGPGSAANQINGVEYIFIDGTGNLYTGDNGNERLQKFPPNSSSSTNGITVAGGNGAGIAPNQFHDLGAIITDANGNIYVDDVLNARIQKFPAGSTSTTNGVTVAGGNGLGSAANQFDNPFGLAVDSNGNIYVADSYNDRVQKWAVGATMGITIAGGTKGSAYNQLNQPSAVFLDASGNNLYIADALNHRIQKWQLK